MQGYLQQVCKELSSLGFTEVVFDDFYFPTSGNIAYEWGIVTDRNQRTLATVSVTARLSTV